MPTDSVLDAQAELVRSRVLEGVAQLLSEGEELTFARVATAAGVSERTVYRHFANRDALMAAVYSWANDRIGFAGTPPTTAADMTAMVRQVFPGFDAVAPVVDELLTSAEGRRARLADLDARRRAATAVVADAAPTLDATTQRQVAAVVQVLGSAAVWQALRDFWDMDGAEAATRSRLSSTCCWHDPNRKEPPNDHWREPHRSHDPRPRSIRRVLHRRARSRARLHRADTCVPSRDPARERDLVAPPRRGRRQRPRCRVGVDVRPRPSRPPRPHRV